MRRVHGLSRPLLKTRFLSPPASPPPFAWPPPSSAPSPQPPPSLSASFASLVIQQPKFPFSRAGVLPSFATAAAKATEVSGGEASADVSPGFSPKQLVLYQYAACPFCNKVRAFLDYNKFPYKVVEVNPISKKEIKWSEYKKVPVVVIDGEQLTDSSQIIKSLNQQINPTEGKLNGVSESEEEKWCRWVDDHLVHVLAPNIYRSPSEALESFDYITTIGNFTAFERWTAKYAGAMAMYFVSKKLKKKHNITDERAALYSAVETWVNALNSRFFMGGGKPNLADLSVFGVLRPIWDLQSGHDMAKNTIIGPWYNRMETAVGESSALKG